MNPKEWSRQWSVSLFAFLLLPFVAGCGGGMSNPAVQPQSGTVFVSGTDAPLQSVVSFQVDITGLSVTDANNNSQSVLSGTWTSPGSTACTLCWTSTLFPEAPIIA